MPTIKKQAKRIYTETALKIRTLKTQKSTVKNLKRIAKNKATNRTLSRVTKSKKPADYTNTSYIFIRANEEDNGTRPVQGISCLSPDLNVIPADADPGALEETQIEPGRQYHIECIIRNLGDLDLPMVAVDFFLVTPALGFNVTAAKALGITSTTINGQGSSRVTFDWIAGSEDSGHRCLFARAYSHSPSDLPDDYDAFDARNDRHIAQQNLTVLNEGDTLDFDVYPAERGQKGGAFQIIIRPVNKLPDKLIIHPAIKKLAMKTSRVTPKFNVVEKPNFLKGGASLTLRKKTNQVGWSGNLKKATVARFTLVAPPLRLRRREAKAFELIKIDTKTRKEAGSIMIIVRGK